MTSFLDQGRDVRWVDLLFGPVTEEIGFVATFLLGACFFLYRDRLSPYLTWKTALTSVALALLAFRSEHLQFFARAALLAFPVFWLAFKADVGVLQRLNSRWDISYGTYLYGWPIAITILFFYRGVSPLALALTALPLAWLAGLASWVLVENAAGQVANRYASPNRAT